jgi:hypothetical protein
MNAKKHYSRLANFLIIIIAVSIIIFLCIRITSEFNTIGIDSTAKIIDEIPSPDGENIAYVFEKDSGATSWFVYRMTILKKGQNLGKSNGNTFIANKQFQVRWESDDTVIVDVSEDSEIYKQEKQINNIFIKYVSDEDELSAFEQDD